MLSRIPPDQWPSKLSAYIVSKAALNAYRRVLAKKYPDIAINVVTPGFSNTDIIRMQGSSQFVAELENLKSMPTLPHI